MNCMKCGKETKGSDVFCPHCQAVMEKYPVKPDAHVHLPKRTQEQQVNKQKRSHRIWTTEEELTSLRKKVRWLLATSILLILLLGVVSAQLVYTTLNKEDPMMGRNYTYEETTE